MPVVKNTGMGFTTPKAPFESIPDPTGKDIWSAAFGLESDVAAMVDLATRPKFKLDPTFDLGKTLKDENLWEAREHFLDVHSADEFAYRSLRLEKERKQRQTLERAGWAGVAAAVTAGLLSPTMFIPLTAGGRGVKALLEGTALGFGAGLAQEVPLQMAQEERTFAESAIGVGAATIVGGLLGGAVGIMSRDELEKVIGSVEGDMVGTPSVTTIPSPAGAAASRSQEAGPLKGGAVVRQLAKIGPVTRTLAQETSSLGRWMMAQMGDAGVGLQRNVDGIPTTPGGTVENRVRTWYSNYWKATQFIDEQFADLVGTGAGPFRGLRSTLQGQFTGPMARHTFRREVARAMFSGDEHSIPQVQAVAQFIRKELWDPLYNEAVSVGIFRGNEEALGDPSHMLRMFNQKAIEARKVEFVDLLAANRENQLREEFASASENFVEYERRVQEYVEDVRRSPEEVAALRADYEERLRALEESREGQIIDVDGAPYQLDEYEDIITSLRAQARTAKRAGDLKKRDQLLSDARGMEAIGGETLENLKKNRVAIRRRLRNLSRAAATLEDRKARALARIESMEEANLTSLNRLVKKGQNILRQMDKWSDKKLDAEVVKLKDRFAELAEQVDKTDDRILKLMDDPATDAQLFALDELQQRRTAKMTDVAERIEEFDVTGRAAARTAIQSMLDEAVQKTNTLVSRRAVRIARAEERMAKLDPEQVEAHVARRVEKLTTREQELYNKWRERGGDDVDLRAGTASFARIARESAEETTDRILGTYLRLPVVDMLQTERGSEIARVLNMSSTDEFTVNGKALSLWDFLEQDVETLIRAHLRTMAPDIELMKKFRVLGIDNFDWRNMIRPLVDEENEALRRIADNPKLTEGQKKKQSEELQTTYAGIRRDLEATISRLRHTFGLPKDPDAMTTRLARIMLNMNTLRLMGTVTISSVADVAQPVMKFGLTRVFRDAFIPLMTNFAGLRLSAHEVKLAGEALDPVMHTRAAAVFDVLDEVGRYSKMERGLEYATNRQGIIALFDYWTSAMKQYAGVVANAQLLDSVRTVTEGGSNKAVKKATEILARTGIDGATAARIWDEVLRGGGGKVNGVWWPNTEDWTDPELVRTFRAALSREVNRTIITPGVERPLWVNSTMLGRLISQFQSFAFSSTTKTVMAGLQEKDAAFVVGSMISLAMGALSYYLWAMSVGGQAKEEMLKMDPGKWADEAISRSGLLGVGETAHRVLERIPGVQPYTTFSGQRNTRRGGDDLIGAALGPSFDYLENLSAVIAGIDDPTQGTANAARRLMPWQNVFYMRQAYDKVFESLDLPESRR